MLSNEAAKARKSLAGRRPASFKEAKKYILQLFAKQPSGLFRILNSSQGCKKDLRISETLSIRAKNITVSNVLIIEFAKTGTNQYVTCYTDITKAPSQLQQLQQPHQSRVNQNDSTPDFPPTYSLPLFLRNKRDVLQENIRYERPHIF
eukprot:Pgem_evm2s9654